MEEEEKYKPSLGSVYSFSSFYSTTTSRGTLDFHQQENPFSVLKTQFNVIFFCIKANIFFLIPLKLFNFFFNFYVTALVTLNYNQFFTYLSLSQDQKFLQEKIITYIFVVQHFVQCLDYKKNKKKNKKLELVHIKGRKEEGRLAVKKDRE